MAKQEFLSKTGLEIYHEEVKEYVTESVGDANTFATEADAKVLSDATSHADNVANTAESNAKKYTDMQIQNYAEWGKF